MDTALKACLITNQHFLVIPESSSSEELGRQIFQACLDTIDIQPATVVCTPRTTVDDFNHGIMRLRTDLPDTIHSSMAAFSNNTIDGSHDHTSHNDKAPARDDMADEFAISEVIIARDLDRAAAEVQIQVIELLRTNRIFTRDTMQRAPKNFLLVAVLSSSEARLQHHLNDMFAVSLRVAGDDHRQSNHQSIAEVLHRLQSAALAVNLTAEIDSYLHHIVLFMRNSRYAQGGVTPAATRHFRLVSKALAALQHLDFVTPTHVMQAARMIYHHRIVLATAETERSLQWGSDQEAIARILEHVTNGDVIEDVIASVPAPL